MQRFHHPPSPLARIVGAWFEVSPSSAFRRRRFLSPGSAMPPSHSLLLRFSQNAHCLRTGGSEREPCNLSFQLLVNFFPSVGGCRRLCRRNSSLNDLGYPL